MTANEIAAIVIIAIQFIIIYWLVSYNRDLFHQNRVILKNLQDSEKRLGEAEKRTKLSNDVIAVLNDLRSGGAILEVNRIDRNSVFFHHGDMR
jgi:hypothetical protein